MSRNELARLPWIVNTTAVAPRMSRMLAMFDPTMLPSEMPGNR